MPIPAKALKGESQDLVQDCKKKKIWLLLVLEYPQHSHFQSFATENYFLKRERVCPEITKFQDIVLIHELATMISC